MDLVMCRGYDSMVDIFNVFADAISDKGGPVQICIENCSSDKNIGLTLILGTLINDSNLCVIYKGKNSGDVALLYHLIEPKKRSAIDAINVYSKSEYDYNRTNICNRCIFDEIDSNLRRNLYGVALDSDKPVKKSPDKDCGEIIYNGYEIGSYIPVHMIAYSTNTDTSKNIICVDITRDDCLDIIYKIDKPTIIVLYGDINSMYWDVSILSRFIGGNTNIKCVMFGMKEIPAELILMNIYSEPYMAKQMVVAIGQLISTKLQTMSAAPINIHGRISVCPSLKSDRPLVTLLSSRNTGVLGLVAAVLEGYNYSDSLKEIAEPLLSGDSSGMVAFMPKSIKSIAGLEERYNISLLAPKLEIYESYIRNVKGNITAAADIITTLNKLISNIELTLGVSNDAN